MTITTPVAKMSTAPGAMIAVPMRVAVLQKYGTARGSRRSAARWSTGYAKITPHAATTAATWRNLTTSKKVIATVMAAAILFGALAAGAQAREKRVLLVSEARGFVHGSIPDAVSFFSRLGGRRPRYDVVPVAGAAQLTRGRLRNADGVVFANTSGEVPLPDRGA